MKRICTTSTLTLVILAVVIWVVPAIAQPQLTAKIDTVSQKIKEVEEKIISLQDKQSIRVESLNAQNEFYWNLILLLGSFAALLLGFQVYVGIVQHRREGKREQERDLVERTGVEQVSKIMGVVHQTLESRLEAEEKEREKREESEKKLNEVLGHIKPFEQFYQRFQMKIQKTREILEDIASQRARDWKRHDFRDQVKELDKFASEFDEFIDDSNLLEEDVSHPFTARVFYIRGIAAHYANQPEVAKRYLGEVVHLLQQLPDEDEIAFNRRTANAYYYLGLIETNFGNNEQAIAHFENANKRDLQHRDFLTRAVMSETYVTAGNFDQAYRYITEIERGLVDIERKEGGLANSHLRLQSRTALIKANIEILKRSENWSKAVKEWLGVVHIKDAQYYYATATLAQAYAASDDFEKARDLFFEAYNAILSSRDIEKVKEIRSRILLLMTAGICAKQSASEEGKRMSDDYLSEADRLRDNLPKIDSKICTVFSLLSKKNEKSEDIHHHIEMIRDGKMLANIKSDV